jgi:hypothetical protein
MLKTFIKKLPILTRIDLNTWDYCYGKIKLGGHTNRLAMINLMKFEHRNLKISNYKKMIFLLKKKIEKSEFCPKTIYVKMLDKI